MSAIQRNIDQHEVTVDGNFLRMRFIGPHLPQTATALLQLVDQLFRTHGSVFLLADVSQSDPPVPSTRHVIATWPYLGRYVVVVFGLNTVQYAVTQLMLAAQRLLGSANRPDVHLCRSEAHAEAVMATLRSQSASQALEVGATANNKK